MKVKFENVSKKFGSIIAVEHINFNIQPGEFVFITGPSGSGKTTILRLITAYYLPDEGDVFLEDIPTKKAKKRQILEMRKKIGMIFQEFKLIPEMNIAENVAVALDIANVDKKTCQEKVLEALSLVGMEERKTAFPLQLSGGELQKVCLARALAIEPEILMADEPTGNLDPVSGWELVKLLVQANEKGKTVIMATHNFDIVNSLKKRIIKLEKGKMIKDKKGKN